MKRWEDILKERLEGYESPLPEGGLAEFRALREGGAASSGRKVSPWLWGIPTAVAAGLAALFVLRHPASSDGGIQVVQQPAGMVAAASDTTEIQEPFVPAELPAQVTVPAEAHTSAVHPRAEDTDTATELTADVPSARPMEENGETMVPDEVQPEAGDERPSEAYDNTTTSPFIPGKGKSRPYSMKVGSAAGVIAGGGLLATVITPLMGAGRITDADPVQQGNPPDGPIMSDPDAPEDKYTGEDTHHMPLKVGLSARIPLAGRLAMTTGLEYSLYQSAFTYSQSGKQKQSVHYLGIPVRLDWMLAENRWLDVYVGAGGQVDYCLGAALAGEPVAKDALSFSLLGAGGIQLNLTKRLGLYVEPQISWTVPSDKQVLSTWRSDHPLMLSVAGGLRITICK